MRGTYLSTEVKCSSQLLFLATQELDYAFTAGCTDRSREWYEGFIVNRSRIGFSFVKTQHKYCRGPSRQSHMTRGRNDNNSEYRIAYCVRSALRNAAKHLGEVRTQACDHTVYGSTVSTYYVCYDF